MSSLGWATSREIEEGMEGLGGGAGRSLEPSPGGVAWIFQRAAILDHGTSPRAVEGVTRASYGIPELVGTRGALLGKVRLEGFATGRQAGFLLTCRTG